MTFAVDYVLAARPVGPGDVPIADYTIYVSLGDAVDGDGTAESPRNEMPGLDAGDTTVLPGTNIIWRGVWNSTTGNFGQLLRAGTASKPVVYIGNDPDWGEGIIDGSVQLSPVACTSESDAFGNLDWPSLRRSDITGIGGNTAQDYLHCAYAGEDRSPRYFSGYPQLSNDDCFDYLQFAQPQSWADVIWRPGQPDPDELADFVADESRPRIHLPSANTAMGLDPGTLEDAIDENALPILKMRISANKWYTAIVERCDADGTPNAAGDYITPISGEAALEAGNAAYTSPGEYAYRIFNLAKAIDRPNQYAMNPVDGWLLDWPNSGSETLYRARGNSGLRIGANYIWVHGGKICGMSRTLTVTPPTGASNGDSIDVAPAVDSSTIRVQRIHFSGFGSIGRPDNPPAYDECGHAARYYNTYENSLNGNTLAVPDGSGADIRFNRVFNNAGGIRVIGNHVTDVTISGNFVEDVNDIHGNGITLYANKYNVEVSGNLIKNVGRPIVSEAGTIYDEVTYGTASCVIKDNWVQASGYGTAAALRLQSDDPLEIGVSVTGNRLDGGVGGNTYLIVHPDLVVGSNGPCTGNYGVGAAATGNTVTFLATGTNYEYTRASAEGIALINEISNRTAPPTDYAPNGVGHLAGL